MLPSGDVVQRCYSEVLPAAAPLGRRAAEIYPKFAADHADKDFSAIIEGLRNTHVT
ncbi:MAG: hypothetical protein ACRDU0_06775 [Mycobacterium sp.]